MALDRRSFLQIAAGTAAACGLPAWARALPGKARLGTPRYDQVKLGDGIAKEQGDIARAVLATLEDDALLKPFRAMGRQPAPGRDIGGWYAYLPDYDWHTGDAGFAPGHCFGQWTSALARFAVADGDDAGKNRLLRLHERFAGAITPDFFDITRFPAYTLDKLNIGLYDAQVLLHSPDALAIADKVRQCALPSLPGEALDREAVRSWRRDRDQSFGWDESYTLPENLYLLAAAGAGSQFLSMARSYLLESFFTPLAEGNDVLGGLHGYSHLNALCSAMQAFFVEGNDLHFKAAQNGFRMVQAQTYATGGWAPDETFEKPGSGKLLASLRSTHNNFETPCGTYATMKLCRYLLQATRDGAYGDAMERVIYNSMFGALPLQPDGRSFYYADLNETAKRVYSAHRWPCCAGTYPQVAADYGISSYLLGPEPEGGPWVILYLPSSLQWRQAGSACRLTQIGAYPLQEQVDLQLETERPGTWPLRLRIPAWCPDPGIEINGQPQAVRVHAGFANVRRHWHHGDRIRLRLPFRPRLEPLPADGGMPSSLAALCLGPLVLLCDRPGTISQESLRRLRRSGPTEWQLGGTPLLTFRPFFAVGDKPYTTYLRTI